MDPSISNLLTVKPLGGLDAKPMDYIQLNKLMGIKKHEITLGLGEEYDYIDHYQNKILPKRKERAQEAQKRQERVQGVQSKIIEQQEKLRKQQAEQRDIEYSKELQENERKELERERAEKMQNEKKDNQVLQIIQQYPFLDYETSKSMLANQNWDLQAVLHQLQGQYAKQKQEEEKKENSILQFLTEFPAVEYDQAVKLLSQKGWDIDQAASQYRGNFQIRLNLILIGIQGLPQQIACQFYQTDDGMSIIRYLNQQRDPKDKYYKLYKDQNCQQQLTYLDLTKSFIQLKLNQHETIFVKEDSLAPF